MTTPSSRLSSSGVASFEVPATVTGASDARRFTSAALAAWGCHGHSVDDVQLAVYELVANALLHTDSAPELTLRLTGSRLRIEVSDESAEPPSKRDGGRDGGWGLRLVESLAVSWGTERDGAGKRVWCELELGRTDESARAVAG
ncbi:ATP-binding protein [Amycolatopsis minnesotensis]|uniref:ATP-binding protein n=1 Tax=Amycolatopsis minnesotensis TaxID=337894 RepID=A0ABN2RLC8_9PSEU